MQIVQSGEPVGEVVSLALLKQDARVDHDDDDAILEQYLAAATDWVQDACQTVLLETEFKATGGGLALSFANFPNPNISSITFTDALGVAGSITDFRVVDGRLDIPSPPDVAAAEVTFKAGLGAGNVPEKIRRAILMLAIAFYDQGSEEIPKGVRAMVAMHRTLAHT